MRLIRLLQDGDSSAPRSVSARSPLPLPTRSTGLQLVETSLLLARAGNLPTFQCIAAQVKQDSGPFAIERASTERALAVMAKTAA
ncbi:hypothetical protein PF003_g26732 [Phytophthora fragariae]|nr:hypothetical protein PF003_g26732 [Phytophthora fragariae]